MDGGRSRRRAAPPVEISDATEMNEGAGPSSPRASPHSPARATRRHPARSQGRVSYVPAYPPELDEEPEEVGNSTRRGHARDSARNEGSIGEVVDGNEFGQDGAASDHDADSPEAAMRPQRSRRNLRGQQAGESQDGESQTASSPREATPTASRGSPKKRGPTGRPRGRPRKDASANGIKREPPAGNNAGHEDALGASPKDEEEGASSRSPQGRRSSSKMSSSSKVPGEGKGTRRARTWEEAHGGFIEEVATDEEARELIQTTLTKLRAKLEEEGSAAATSCLEEGVEGVSEDGLINFQIINDRAVAGAYSSTVDFEKDMMQLFHAARRHLDAGSKEYGVVLAVQRMYQHITQSVAAVHGDVEDAVEQRNYSSIRYGPGQSPSEEEKYGEAPSLAVKTPTRDVRYKGQRYVVGNWVHLSNPTDPTRPIVAQIFKTRSEDLGTHNQDWITACWFLRPEQTRHTADMQFWENEVVKTTMLIEHHIEDVLEFICVMPPVKYVRGRPADGEGGWTPGSPLYVCEYRYNVEQSAFTAIKNWMSGMPEDTKSRKFNMEEFEEQITMPEKLDSPFLRGVEGPGELVTDSQLQAETMASIASQAAPAAAGPAGVVDPRARRASLVSVDGAEKREIPMLFKEYADEIKANKRFFKKARKEQQAYEERQRLESHQTNGMQLSASPSGQNGLSSHHEHKLGAASASPMPAHSPSAGLRENSGTPSGQQRRSPLVAQVADRSLGQAMNQMPDASGFFRPLSQQAQQLFQQDPQTGAVLWHAAPPVTEPSQANAQRKWNNGERFQAHSLDYLYKLATSGLAKQRQGDGAAAADQEVGADTSMADAHPDDARALPKDKAPEAGKFERQDAQDPGRALAQALRHAGRTLSEKHNVVADKV